jgi:putative nucleotidyltransferase with HDIG domain
MESAVPDFILESVRSLPPLPASAARLLELAGDPDADLKEVARVIELDQTLTARVLRAANSALYGVPRRVQTVQQATVLLGRDAVVNLCLGISVMAIQSATKNDRWPFAPADFWRHSFGVAALAHHLAKRIPGVSADEAFVAGLMHDIGKLVLLEHFGEVYSQVVLAAQYGTKPLFMLEQEVLDTDHAVAGHALCLHWKIPAAITRAISEHHDSNDSAPRTVADVVRNANDLVKAAGIGYGGSHFAELRTSANIPSRQINPGDLRTLIVGLPEEVREAEHAFGSTVSSEEASAASGTSLVHQHIEDLTEREFVRCVLWSMGHETQPVGDAFPADPSKVRALVTDGPLPGRIVSDYHDAGIPVLDYAAWRAGDGQPSGNHFNVVVLRKWFAEQMGRLQVVEEAVA